MLIRRREGYTGRIVPDPTRHLRAALCVAALLAGAGARAGGYPGGEDLSAWRAIPEDASAGDWLAFIASYPHSPLAERAWASLAESGQAPDRVAGAGSVARHLDASLDHHRRAAGEPLALVPVRLTDAPAADARAPEGTRVALSAVAGADGTAPLGLVGASIGLGPGALALRIGGPDVRAELGLRGTTALPRVGPIHGLTFLEATADSRGRLGGWAGVGLPLGEALGLDVGAGAAWEKREVVPRVRVGLTFTLPRS